MPSDELAYLQKKFYKSLAYQIFARFNPQEQLIVQAVSDMLFVEWCGESLVKLPATLVWTEDEAKKLQLEYQAFLPLSTSNDRAIKNVLSELVSECWETKEAFLATQQPVILQALQHCIYEGGQYALLSSLLTELVPAVREVEKPLWQEIKRGEAYLEKSGEPNPEQTNWEQSVEVPVNRKLHHVGVEVDVAARLDAWFLRLVQHYHDPGRRDGVTGVFVSIQPESTTLYYQTTSGKKVELGEDFIESTSYQEATLETVRQEHPVAWLDFDKRLTFLYMQQFYAQSDGARDLSGLLDGAVQLCAESVAELVKDGYRYRVPRGGLMPQLPVRSQNSIWLSPLEHESQVNRVTYLTHQEFISLTRAGVGKVVERDYAEIVPRLILKRYWSAEALEEPPASFHLALEMSQVVEEGYGLVIPGYVSLGYVDATWYFMRNENDPYAGAEKILLPVEGVRNLAQHYQTIGLTGLAAELYTFGKPSLRDLTFVLTKWSQQSFDEKYTETVYLDDQPGLQSFAHYVQAGKLQIQSELSAQFLMASLHILFPDEFSTVLTGLVLSDAEQLRELPHAQVLFVYDGVEYILDASLLPFEAPPAKRRGAVPLQSNQVDETGLLQRMAAVAHYNQLANHTRLDHFLHNVLRVRTQAALVQKLGELTDSDPIRRTVGLISRMEAGMVSEREIDEGKAYLERYLAMSPRDGLSLGLPYYGELVLRQLLTLLGLAEVTYLGKHNL